MAEHSDLKTNWITRTACLFFLICHCVSVDTGCDKCEIFGNFGKLPLSSPKTLWEAKSRADWEVEYSTYSNRQESVLETMEMLIDAQKGNHDPAKTQLLDHWNCRADNLGSLLAITASIA